MLSKKETGNRGEEMAASFLAEKGYSILERNWRFLKLEVDIIARHEDTIVIVEVKSRSTREFGDPASFVTKKKQKFLIRAANHYALSKDIDHEVRFDIVSIFDYGSGAEIDHIEDAFYPIVNQNRL